MDRVAVSFEQRLEALVPGWGAVAVSWSIYYYVRPSVRGGDRERASACLAQAMAAEGNWLLPAGDAPSIFAPPKAIGTVSAGIWNGCSPRLPGPAIPFPGGSISRRTPGACCGISTTFSDPRHTGESTGMNLWSRTITPAPRVPMAALRYDGDSGAAPRHLLVFLRALGAAFNHPPLFAETSRQPFSLTE